MPLEGTWGPGQWLTRDPSNPAIGIISSVRPGPLASPLDLQTEAGRAANIERMDENAITAARDPSSTLQSSPSTLASGPINQQAQWLEQLHLREAEEKKKKLAMLAQIQAIQGA